jgi:hypothetical protein
MRSRPPYHGAVALTAMEYAFVNDALVDAAGGFCSARTNEGCGTRLEIGCSGNPYSN